LAWKVKVEIQLLVLATDQNKAENLVLDLVERHLGDMLDCPQVMATSLRMGADNPSSKLASQSLQEHIATARRAERHLGG
jgi:hypothetical protein